MDGGGVSRTVLGVGRYFGGKQPPVNPEATLSTSRALPGVRQERQRIIIRALFPVAKGWKQLEWPSAGVWRNKPGDIPTVHRDTPATRTDYGDRRQLARSFPTQY